MSKLGKFYLVGSVLIAIVVLVLTFAASPIEAIKMLLLIASGFCWGLLFAIGLGQRCGGH